MTMIDPFGAGILCPFQRDGKGDFAHGSGLPVLHSDVGELLGVIGPAGGEPGEVPWRTDLGSRLVRLKHRGYHQELTRATADQETSQVLRRWEPRVTVAPAIVRQVDEAEGTVLYIEVPIRPLAVSGSPFETVTLKVKE